MIRLLPYEIAGRALPRPDVSQPEEEEEEEEEEYTKILGLCCVREEFQKIPKYILFTILQDHAPLSKD